MKNKLLKICALTLTALLAAGCAQTEAATSVGAESVTSTGADFTYHYVSYDLDENDTDADYDEADATRIVFDGESASVHGEGADADGADVLITKKGTYILSGNSDDGNITIYVEKDDVVKLVFDGLSLKNADGAAIYSMQAEKTIIILAAGTENVIEDGAEYSDLDDNDEPDAAIFAKDDMTLLGEGKLLLTSNYADGIVSKDVLCVTGGEFAINSADDAFRGTDGLVIAGGSFEVSAGGNGFKSTKDEETKKGFVLVKDGDINISNCQEGIEAPRIQIDGGNIVINAQDDAINAAANTSTTTTTTDTWGGGAGGAGGAGTPPDMSGISGEGSMGFPGGEISGENGWRGGEFASNEGAGMRGGKGGRGSWASGEAAGGFPAQMAVATGEAMAETVEFGDIAGGGMAGGGMAGEENVDYVFVRITGGTLDITGRMDGIDSNGAIYIDGGNIKVAGPTGTGNCAIDCNGKLTVTGGELDVTGSVEASGGIEGWTVPEENASSGMLGGGGFAGGAV